MTVDRALAHILLVLGAPLLVTGALLLLSPATGPAATHLTQALAPPAIVLGATATVGALAFYRLWRSRWLLLGTALPLSALILWLVNA